MKVINKKNPLIIFTSLIAVFLMISTVSAVPYVNEKQLTSDNIFQERIHQIINSPSFQRLKKITESAFNKTYNESVRTTIRETLWKNITETSPKQYSSYIEDYFAIILIIMEFLLSLLGNGLVRLAVISGIGLLLCTISSIVQGITMLPTVIILLSAFIADLYVRLYSDTIIYTFGAIGAVCLAIVMLPIAFLTFVIGVPSVDLVLVALCMVKSLVFISVWVIGQ